MEELQAGVKSASRLFTWEEIKFFSGQGHPQQERWLVIDRKVYDIGKFYHHHPGGSKVIRHYTGQDATVRATKSQYRAPGHGEEGLSTETQDCNRGQTCEAGTIVNSTAIDWVCLHKTFTAQLSN